MNFKQFLKTIEGTYKDDEYCTVVGWDIEMENFEAECKIKRIIPESKLYTVCVYQGVRVLGLFFDKEWEDTLKPIVYGGAHGRGYGRLVMNGKNPFC